MLDDDDGVTRVNEPMHQIKKTANIGEVKPNSGFLQKKKMMCGTAGSSLGVGLVSRDLRRGQFGDQLQSLSFST
jgi:hypothetical protein